MFPHWCLQPLSCEFIYHPVLLFTETWVWNAALTQMFPSSFCLSVSISSVGMRRVEVLRSRLPEADREESFCKGRSHFLFEFSLVKCPNFSRNSQPTTPCQLILSDRLTAEVKSEIKTSKKQTGWNMTQVTCNRNISRDGWKSQLRNKLVLQHYYCREGEPGVHMEISHKSFMSC